MNSLRSLLFLTALGPTCLILGLVCTLLKCAREFWPIIVLGVCGFFLTWILKKRGLALSLFLLASVVISYFRTFWPSLLASSLALSWLLLLLGHQEAALLLEDKQKPVEEKSLQALEANYAQLKTQFEEKKEMLHKIRKELFAMETALLKVQRDHEEEALKMEDDPLIATLKQLEEENRALECQVSSLEELVSSLLASSEKQTSRQSRQKKQSLEVDFLSFNELSKSHIPDR